MDENIVFFVRCVDIRELQIRSVTREELKRLYGHAELLRGMILEQEDVTGNPATEVVEILKGDLARKWKAITCLEDAFTGTAEPLLTDFTNAILAVFLFPACAYASAGRQNPIKIGAIAAAFHKNYINRAAGSRPCHKHQGLHVRVRSKGTAEKNLARREAFPSLRDASRLEAA